MLDCWCSVYACIKKKRKIKEDPKHFGIFTLGLSLFVKTACYYYVYLYSLNCDTAA